MTAIAAEGLVEHAPERVYAFLAELDNHWRLSDPYLRLESLRPDRRGARISIRTPWGLRRTARTAVTTAIAPKRLGGTAVAGERTRASVYWTIEPSERGALVGLEANVLAAGFLDRLLLALGGRWWLRRRFDRVVSGLGAALDY